MWSIWCNVKPVKYSTKFRIRFNNYKKDHRNYNLKKSVPQASFHSHFNQPDHHGMEDWSFTIIDQTHSDINFLRQRECFWQIRLDILKPKDFNDREVTFDYGQRSF